MESHKKKFMALQDFHSGNGLLFILKGTFLGLAKTSGRPTFWPAAASSYKASLGHGRLSILAPVDCQLSTYKIEPLEEPEGNSHSPKLSNS